MNNVVQKFSMGFLVFATVVWTFSSAIAVPQAKAIAAGDLLKGPNSDAVYYVGSDMKKYVFPDAKTYFTWYKNFNNIQKVSVATLDLYPSGGAVTYRPGTKLVKTVDSNKTYAVEPGGKLRWITSEATAISLWGSNWGKRVNDVIPGYFASTYTVTTDLGTTFPTGSLIQKTGEATIYYVDGTTIRPFSSGDAFTVNGLDFANVVMVSSTAGYTGGSNITGLESAIASIQASTNVPVVGGTVSVALASDTPASGMVLASSARVPFTKVNFTNGSNVDVTVDQVVIQRMGLAQDGAFAGVELLKASDMSPLNTNDKTFASDHTATFNDDFVIPANSTMGVILAGNIVNLTTIASYAGETPVLGLKTVTLKTGSTLSGTLPILGNYQTLNSTITIGKVTVASGADAPSALTKEVGTTDYIVASLLITASSTEDMLIKSIAFTNNGSTSATDVKNLRLVNATTNAVLSTVASYSGKRVMFDNLNLTLLKSQNVTLDLKLDIESGSLRTIDMQIDKQADITVMGKTYGYNSLPEYATDSSPYYNPADTTVGNGSLRVESVSVSPTNIPENQTQVTLGKFKFVAKGEVMNVTSLGWIMTMVTSAAATDHTDLTNVTVYNPAGAVVAGPKDLLHTSTAAGGVYTATTTDSMQIPIGETIYTVKADLNSDFSTNDTIAVSVDADAMTVKGDITGNAITPTPATPVSSSTMTVKSSALAASVSTTPSANTIVGGAQDLEVANFILDASNSATNIKITNIKPVIHTTSAVYPALLSGWTLWDGATQIVVNSDSMECTTSGCVAAGDEATTTLSMSSDALVIPAGTSKTIKVKVDVGTGATSGDFSVGLQTDAITAIDAQAQTATVTVTGSDGQAMSPTTGGTLNVAVLSDPAAAAYVAGSTYATIGSFTLQAKYEGVNLNSFGFTLADASEGINGNYEDMTMLSLWDGATKLGETALSGANATITPSLMSMAANAEKTLTVKANIATLSSSGSAAASGETFYAVLSNIDATGTSVGSSAITVVGEDNAFANQTIFKSVPTFAKVDFAGADTIVGVGDFNLYKFSVSANSAGPVGLYKFSFGVATTSETISTDGFQLYESDSSSSNGNIISDSGDYVTTWFGNGGFLVETYFDVNNDSALAPGYETRVLTAGQTKYYTLMGRITPDGTVNNGSVSTLLAGDSGFAATTAKTATGVTAVADNDFIWSDLNFDLYTTATASKTLGWFNGFRVPGMPVNSTTYQTLTD